ncbi:MAG: efflux RND transporter periplasmic adaptor subunit [Desulfovibrio sp.]|nr:efflux RND transporter periplasmic adaptor subunit [Desulfovibrio sp.]
MHNLPFKAALAVGITLCLCLPAGCDNGGRGNPPNAAASVAVEIIHPRTVTFTTELAGRISAFQISDVRPQVNGILQKRLFEEGTDVQAGAILYKIDPAVYKANYDAAKAQLVRAEANVLPTKLKVGRERELIKEHAVSPQNFEASDAAYKQALADVEVARAALEHARINLDYTDVISPISGRIGLSAVTPGALMAVGQPNPMVTVQQLDPMYVDVTQSATQLLRLRRSLESGRMQRPENGVGDLRLILEDGTQYNEKGTLKFTDVSVDKSTGSVTLRAVFPNPGLVLLPGMYARVILDEGTDDKAILLPQQALMRDVRGNSRVYVVNDQDIVEIRNILVGRTHAAYWVVLEGLREGDRVIREGLQFVRPGMAVTVKTPTGEPQNGADPRI